MAEAAFTDLTQDADPHHAEGIHPDQHAIVTVPGKPLQFITGSDGGVVRSDGKVADISYKCDTRGLDARGPGFVQEPVEQGREPARQHEQRPVDAAVPKPVGERAATQNLLQGGTQDNGTFQYNGSPIVWPQEIYGDGGQSGFNVANDALRFNTFTGQANDANFRNGDPTKWVIISAPIFSSPEGSLFYPPVIADPNPATAGSIFQGSFSVWRTQDWGGNQAYLEANCPEFTTFAGQPGCGNFVAIGDGVPSTQLTAAGVGKPWRRCGRLDLAGSAKHRVDVGGDEHGPRVHHRKRERSGRVRSLEPGRRRVDRSQPIRYRDVHRSDECPTCMDLLQRL